MLMGIQQLHNQYLKAFSTRSNVLVAVLPGELFVSVHFKSINIMFVLVCHHCGKLSKTRNS